MKNPPKTVPHARDEWRTMAIRRAWAERVDRLCQKYDCSRSAVIEHALYVVLPGLEEMKPHKFPVPRRREGWLPRR